LLKPEQVAYILHDCQVRVLVTSAQRLALLRDILPTCHDLRHVVLADAQDPPADSAGPNLCAWQHLLATPAAAGHRVIDSDMAAILYTSGSTGKPKGVVLAHRNLVAGARSVAAYLGNHAGDTLLAALPLSFDAGFSQLTTAFHVGARVVLLNYLLPRDVIKAVEREQVTGLTAVPPLYIQLSSLEWPAAINQHLRYFANTGGRMPRETLNLLRQRVPSATPFLMYGLTEAFRSTYLPPAEIDRRPDSIGKAIPNAEILVLRDDGSPSSPTSRANWCIAARWSPSATGTMPRRPPSASGPCPIRHLAAPRASCCRKLPSFPATRCAWTRTATSISSAAATR
jgi:acyl-CoA synthetase (AMP-forming)/AMP-acid ligase II